MRTRQPAHLVAGMNEADYVASGLAAEVFDVLEALLMAEDRRSRTAPRPARGLRPAGRRGR